ncbi:syntaxin-12 [Drosophila grimshawi]|uniref:GH17144 n=1 Tax=Drosophila grimshawi TaxID=7222 RepID=B4J0S1_DROGR|nr:syntaxin-12 [Drosophila grimshawi]XP_032591324.1 syntaxin-12 [Drosophila grimshawi]EDV97926.1 GH17144 [Drosophila grimshawi]
MSQALNNPTGGGSSHRDYGATSSATPEVSFAAASNSGNSGFSPTEFVSLSEDIGHNITAINSSTKQLEKQLKMIGTPKDLNALREKIHSINKKTNTRVQATSSDLQRLQAVVRHGDRQQKLQLDKLTHEFQNVVEKYSTQQKRISLATRRSYQAAAAEQESEIGARSQLLQEQREEQAGLERQHDMLVERQRQVEQIEADIIDVNVIMNKLSNLVTEQGAVVGTIEETIEHTTVNVEEGRSELEKAAASRYSHRRKILILLVIAVIIGLVVTGIIVGKLS